MAKPGKSVLFATEKSYMKNKLAEALIGVRNANIKILFFKKAKIKNSLDNLLKL